MIQLFVKKINMLSISIENIVEIGDLIIKKDKSVVLTNREGGNLKVFGDYIESFYFKDRWIHSIISINDIQLNGYDREYERDFKNLCSQTFGEISASVVVDGGARILRFSSKNGEMIEEEVVI